MKAYCITSLDTVVGIAASGTTPYVIGTLRRCREEGILTASIACNPGAPVSQVAEIPIEVVTGPEYVTGSTRMKAGTAQKLVLNMISTATMIGLGREITNSQQGAQQGYIVDKEGYIDFPVLGRIKVDGITRNQLSELLKEKLSTYLKNPIVTIQFLNFKVTVLGEVKNPGSYKVTTERISLLDALGMAGDLQISGKRKNVLLIRESGNEKQFARIDLTSSDFVDSPFFYLQQNDVIYVEPNKGRVVGGNMGTFWTYVVSSISTIVAIVALIVK